MNFIEYLYNLESGTICIYPNYKTKIQNKTLFPDVISNELNTLLEKYGQENTKIIILIDLTKIEMTTEYASNNLSFYRRLKTRLEHDFQNILERIIIYEYTNKTAFLLTLIKLILDKELRKKIIIDRKYKQFIEKGMKIKTIANNNELHC